MTLAFCQSDINFDYIGPSKVNKTIFKSFYVSKVYLQYVIDYYRVVTQQGLPNSQ